MYDIFSLYLQRGNVDVGFWAAPRLTSSGISTQRSSVNTNILKFVFQGRAVQWRSLLGQSLLYHHATSKRRFPARVDFHTSAGFLSGGDARAKTGVRGGGPQAVVTDLGILSPDDNGELVLAALHPGVSFDQVYENTGWSLKQAPDCQVTAPPTEEELSILREKLDPNRIYI